MSNLAKALTAVQMDLLPTNKLIALRRQIAKILTLPRRRDSAYHVTFGAGHLGLGLGLIVPALARSEESFALVQRASGPFKGGAKYSKPRMVIKGFRGPSGSESHARQCW